MKTLATVTCLFAISLPVHAQFARGFNRQPANIQQAQQFQQFVNSAYQLQLQNYLAQQQQIYLYQQLQQQAILQQQAARMATIYPQQYGGLLPQYPPYYGNPYPQLYGSLYPQFYGSYYPYLGFGFPF